MHMKKIRYKMIELKNADENKRLKEEGISLEK